MNVSSPLARVVRSLDLSADRREVLREIPESAWPNVLHLADEARLILPLAIRCADFLPPAVRARVEGNLQANLLRHERVLADWKEIACALGASNIEFVALKGLSHWPHYGADPAHRPQYDFDLYCPQESILRARDTIVELGYEPLRETAGPKTDHLPALIRRTGFKWRGDYFDPSLPLTVELHHRFWNPARESFEVRSSERFWPGRTIRAVGDMELPALDPLDCLTYATWHAARHLVRGDLRLFHVYEIACFLKETSGKDSFWQKWDEIYANEHCIAEGITFRLAKEWFNSQMHPVAKKAVANLPEQVNRWFRLFADSPILSQERINKDELFLHLSLVKGKQDKLRIAAQKIFPRNPPAVVLDAHSTAAGGGMAIRRAVFGATFLSKRAARHIAALWPVTRSALLWWREG